MNRSSEKAKNSLMQIAIIFVLNLVFSRFNIINALISTAIVIFLSEFINMFLHTDNVIVNWIVFIALLVLVNKAIILLSFIAFRAVRFLLTWGIILALFLFIIWNIMKVRR